ncbi:hypothetical protein JCM3765_003721 [Sporobolomyces pararoseus]
MSNPLSQRRALFLFVSLSCLGFVCFFRGFFPVKPLVQGYTDAQQYSNVEPEVIRHGQVEIEQPFSRLVFMLVDALRSDFVFGSGSEMHFAKSLIVNGLALPYTAVAQSPTVTLPRLKGLTTGSNPTFLDAILNIADEGSSSAALEFTDSWIRQFVYDQKKKEKKLVFAGDDTWLRLFPPSWFEWSEGVSSFFVSDTQIVDSNVTRHLDSLLSIQATRAPSPPSEWDVLILHYLGLDHVGHLEGPKSSMMGPKQREMDTVFERLFRAMELRDQQDGGKSLLVLIGDHGMTEGGNHGGSTESETSSALLLASPSLPIRPSDRTQLSPSGYRFGEVVQQVDLVPTLSVLFDLGIPKNSMGRLIASAVQRLRPSAFSFGLSSNINQMLEVLKAAAIDGNDLICQAASRLNKTCEELRSTHELDFATSSLFLSLAQDELLGSLGGYRMGYLTSALLVLSVSAVGLAALSYRSARKEQESRTKRLIGLAVLVHLVSFFATSFIEEEHEYWFFATATSCLILCSSTQRSSKDRIALLSVAATIRLMRGWSHNGQKDFPNHSISSFLAQHPTSTAILIATTYLLVAFIPFSALVQAARSLSTQNPSPAQLFPKALSFALLATLSSLQALVGIIMKTVTERSDTSSSFAQAVQTLGLEEPSTLARIGYILAGLGGLFSTIVRRQLSSGFRQNLDTLRLAIISLLLMSITRATNIPLFLLFWVQHFALVQVSPSLSRLSFAFLSVALQFCSFFALGGSNSLATVDLSQAYNGLKSYSFPLVTLLTYLSNFSGPIFLSLSSRFLLPNNHSSTSHTIYTTTFFTLSLTTLAISAVHFRYHLFAFTVFSPAVLYKGIWWIAVQLGTNEGISVLLSI